MTGDADGCDHATTLFRITWPGGKRHVWGFEGAKDFLLTELAWLCDDQLCAFNVAAYDIAVELEPGGPFPFRVQAGEPPGWYEMRVV